MPINTVCNPLYPTERAIISLVVIETLHKTGRQKINKAANIFLIMIHPHPSLGTEGDIQVNGIVNKQQLVMFHIDSNVARDL